MRICAYAGAGGALTLYEDNGLTYGYTKSAFTRIPIRWDDRNHMFTIDRREGSLPGMLPDRTFNVVLITGKKPVGSSFAPPIDQTVHHNESAVELRLK